MPDSRLYTLFFLLLFLHACRTPETKEKSKKFTIDVKSITADTVINAAVFYNDHLICLQEDHKVFVLDTNLNRVDSLTNKFSTLKAYFIQVINDTVIIGTSKELYCLKSDFSLEKYNRQPFTYGLPDLIDPTYYVYSCGAGEFGGAVFFLDQRTNKTYSYPATGVQQVLKFKDTYVVSSFLAHLSGFSDYLFIEDPSQLYQLKNEKQKTYCNWYVEDSIKGSKQFHANTPPGVRYYSDSFTTRTLTTFPYNGELYSIYCTDSATVLAKHQTNNLTPVDTLLKRRLHFNTAKTQLFKNGSTTTYWATWAIGGEGNTWIPYQNTGLIYIRNNQITFLEFKTPHMEEAAKRSK